jgi:hypothetical protein
MENAAPGTEVAKNTHFIVDNITEQPPQEESNGSTHSSRETMAIAMVHVAASDDIASACARTPQEIEELYRAVAAR